MANKSVLAARAAKLLKTKKTSFFWLALLPAAALLLSKHSSVKIGDEGEFGAKRAKKAALYSFGKKGSPGRAVIITNQTPSKLAGTAVKGFFGMNK